MCVCCLFLFRICIQSVVCLWLWFWVAVLVCFSVDIIVSAARRGGHKSQNLILAIYVCYSEVADHLLELTMLKWLNKHTITLK